MRTYDRLATEQLERRLPTPQAVTVVDRTEQDLVFHWQTVFAPPDFVPRYAAYYWPIKRSLDIFVAATALVLLSPFLLLLALLIVLHSEGPAIFQQQRVGYDPHTGQPRLFKLYKFRTMRVDADQNVHREHVASLIRNTSPAGRTMVKIPNDHRVTGLGAILRKLSIDELPQLVNVLKGDMTLVGPRPALPYEVECYEDWHMRRLQALPGLTGWWQVQGRCRVSFEEMVNMDIYYIENQCLSLDLKILALTPWAVIAGRGAG